MTEQNDWENANFQDALPKNINVENLPINVRKPTKNPKVLKLRKISAEMLTKAGLTEVAKEARLIEK